MKLNFLPLLAGLFFYSYNLSYSQEEITVNWMEAFPGYDSAETIVPEVEPIVENDSTKACDWYQKNCQEQINGNIISITYHDDYGRQKAIDFWYPSQNTIDSIIFYTKKVGSFEDENGDKSEFSKNERKEFLKKMQYCRKHRIEFLYSLIGNAFSTKTKDGKEALLGDGWTYQRLKGLAEMTATKDLLVIQDYLVLNCWLMHDNHADGKYTPIISEKEYEKIAMSRK